MKLVNHEGPKEKFWEIVLQGKAIFTNNGQLSTSRPPKKTEFKTKALAQAAYDKQVAAKRKAGFRDPYEVVKPEIETARNEALEAAIREDRTDRGPYLVYADWLQSQGSELGELIVLAHAKKQKPAVGVIAKKLGLPNPQLATVGWRFGFWQWLRLENSVDWMNESFDPLGYARPLFASPLCAVLEELRIGIERWDHNDEDVPALLAEAGKHAWAKDLQRLHLGDVSNDIDMAHHVIGDVGKLITKHFPNLRSLKLHSGEQTWRGSKETFGFSGLALPKLTELTIETCAMSRKRSKWLREAKLPALERLEVWYGQREGEANSTVADILPLLDGKLFPTVRHLGIKNCELVADAVRLLPGGNLAKQLETLDLSMGTLNDSEAGELAESAKRFPALKALNVEDSYLTAKGIKRLKAAFPGVKIASGDQRELDDDDDDDGRDRRYASVGE